MVRAMHRVVLGLAFEELSLLVLAEDGLVRGQVQQ